MKHAREIAGYAENHKQLAEEMGDLYYDSLADLLRLLAEKLARDAVSDCGRGRPKLAAELSAAAADLQRASERIGSAWGICAPHVGSVDSR